MDRDRVVIARPSMPASDRAALGQLPRAGEEWASRLQRRWLRWLPRGLRPIEARTVAQALLAAVQRAGKGSAGITILDSSRARARARSASMPI